MSTRKDSYAYSSVTSWSFDNDLEQPLYIYTEKRPRRRSSRVKYRRQPISAQQYYIRAQQKYVPQETEEDEHRYKQEFLNELEQRRKYKLQELDELEMEMRQLRRSEGRHHVVTMPRVRREQPPRLSKPPQYPPTPTRLGHIVTQGSRVPKDRFRDQYQGGSYGERFDRPGERFDRPGERGMYQEQKKNIDRKKTQDKKNLQERGAFQDGQARRDPYKDHLSKDPYNPLSQDQAAGVPYTKSPKPKVFTRNPQARKGFKKFKRTDLRYTQLKEAFMQTKTQLDDLKLALNLFPELAPHQQQKVINDLLPRRDPSINDVVGYSNSSDVLSDVVGYGSDTPYYDQYSHASDFSEQDLERRSKQRPKISIFSPVRQPHKEGYVMSETDSESSQVYMYDDGTDGETLTDPGKRWQLRRSSGVQESEPRKIQPGVSRGDSRPNVLPGMEINTDPQKDETNPSQESQSETNRANDADSYAKGDSLPPGDMPDDSTDDDDDEVDDDEGDEVDEDEVDVIDEEDDEEEDEDGVPFQQQPPLRDEKVGKDSILKEVQMLLNHFKENLGFLYVILRELQNISDYKARLKCLKFFQKFKDTVASSSEDDDGSEKTKSSSERSSSIAKYPVDSINTRRLSRNFRHVNIDSPSTSSQGIETPNPDASMLDQQTAKNKDLLQTLNIKLNELVYDKGLVHGTEFSNETLTNLSRNILLLVSHYVKSATVELLESIHDVVLSFDNTSIAACRDDLIQDILDILYDEMIFNRLINNIDSSYKEDIQGLKERLNSLKRQRKEDIERLKIDRLERLKAGNPYPHSLMRADLRGQQEAVDAMKKDSKNGSFPQHDHIENGTASVQQHPEVNQTDTQNPNTETTATVQTETETTGKSPQQKPQDRAPISPLQQRRKILASPEIPQQPMIDMQHTSPRHQRYLLLKQQNSPQNLNSPQQNMNHNFETQDLGHYSVAQIHSPIKPQLDTNVEDLPLLLENPVALANEVMPDGTKLSISSDDAVDDDRITIDDLEGNSFKQSADPSHELQKRINEGSNYASRDMKDIDSLLHSKTQDLADQAERLRTESVATPKQFTSSYHSDSDLDSIKKDCAKQMKQLSKKFTF